MSPAAPITDLKNWIQGKLEKVTTWLNRKFEKEMRKSIDEPLNRHKAAANIYLWTFEKPRRRFWTGGLRILYTITLDAWSLGITLTNRIFYLIFWTVLAKFPGGAFGIVALILFFVLTWFKILRLYVDAVPA